MFLERFVGQFVIVKFSFLKLWVFFRKPISNYWVTFFVHDQRRYYSINSALFLHSIKKLLQLCLYLKLLFIADRNSNKLFSGLVLANLQPIFWLSQWDLAELAFVIALPITEVCRHKLLYCLLIQHQPSFCPRNSSRYLDSCKWPVLQLISWVENQLALVESNDRLLVWCRYREKLQGFYTQHIEVR